MQAPVQPKVDRPESTHEQVPPIVQDETSQAPTTTPGMNHREETKSVANTATTLRADKFQKASSPSVISTSRSIALSRHEELSFPPAPCGALLRRYKKVKKRVDALRDTAEILVGAAGVNYVEGEEHEGLTSRNISLARMVRGRNKEKEQELHDFWNECVNAVGEITCPYCFHAIPAKEAVDERKWRYGQSLLSRTLSSCLFLTDIVADFTSRMTWTLIYVSSTIAIQLRSCTLIPTPG